MVIGTIFGQRKGHVWFCIQHYRLSTKTFLLLELSIPTQQLVQEISSGMVHIALECDRSLFGVWTMHYNGRKNRICYENKSKSAQLTDVKYHAIYNSGSGDDTDCLRVKN
ncbi:hypothetical protein V6N13_041442 [Hibiscus sabdariffa]